MASLIDTINKATTDLPSQVAAAPVPSINTQQVMAASSGKLGSQVGATSASNIQQQQAAKNNQVAQKQQQQMANLQAAGLQQADKAQTQTFNQESARIDEQSLVSQEKFSRQAAGIMQELKQGKEVLGEQQYQAKLQQATQAIRLTNDKYLNNLELQARRDDLTDNLSFKSKLQEQIWSDEKNLLSSNIQFRDLLQADERSFKDKLASMDLDTAMSMFAQEQKAESTKQLVTGVSGVISAGANAYDKYEAKKETSAVNNNQSLVQNESNEAKQMSQGQATTIQNVLSTPEPTQSVMEKP